MVKINFPDGLIRLAMPTPMAKGDSAFGVVCTTCSANLPMLANPEKADLDFIGNGQLSIPCRFCYAEGLYAPADLKRMVVEEDNTTPVRVLPSGMYRRSFPKYYPGARPTFGPNFVEIRPEAAIIIARCMSLWSEVEAACANLLGQFVGAHSNAASAAFLAIRNSRTQYEAMAAASDAALEERDKPLFAALMHLKDRIERERNKLAHGHYGFSPLVKRGVLWVSVEDRAAHHGSRPHNISDLSKSVFVYEPEDLETIAQEIEDLITSLGQFSAYLKWPQGPRRDERFQQLCNFPHVGEALDELDDRRKNREAQMRRTRQPSPRQKG